MKTSIDKNQIIAIRTLVSKLHLDKEDVIYNASSGRTTKTTELDYFEAEALIRFLRTGQINKSDRANEMRRKIISCCYEMRMVNAKGKIDMAKVNAMVVKYGYLKPKSLNDYTLSELPMLVTQFTKFRDHFLIKKAQAR